MYRFLSHAKLSLLPGLSLCLLIAVSAYVLQYFQLKLTGKAWLEPVVLAILLGAVIRNLVPLASAFHQGIQFSAKIVLEIAIVLLGASISAEAMMAAEPSLLAGVAGVVLLSILLSYVVGRTMRLSHRLALLVACGNSICGNSAIAAAAPVVGANGDDVASSIAFTAVLGIFVVLCLPLLVPILDLSATQYGVLAGLTVYAVPQVLAATAPVAALSVQVGTLVKLVRVMMLGPVLIILSIVESKTGGLRLRFFQIVPWFIIGFVMMIGLHSAELIPQIILTPIHQASSLFTVIAMAALGLGVNFRTVMRSGVPVILSAVISLLLLGLISLTLINVLQI